MFQKLGCACVTLMLAAAGARAGQNVVVVLDNSSSMNIRLRSNQSVTKMDAAKRALLAGYYREKLEAVPEVLPLAIPAYPLKHTWHLFIVRVDEEKAGMDRDRFMAELKTRNIGTGLHFRAAHLQKYYRETMPEIEGTLPHTEWNSQRICSLPLFPDMTPEDVDDVVDAIKVVLSK